MADSIRSCVSSPFLGSLLSCVLLTIPASGQQVTVSPDGPISTFSQAQTEIRAQRAVGVEGTITVTIHGGTYFLAQTLVLGPEDSHTTWQAAAGERPILSGGRQLTGWRKSENGAWTTGAPGPYFHQLFIDDRRAELTRLPSTGYYRFDGAGIPFQQLRLHYRGTDIQPSWAGQPDTYVVGYIAWNDFRSPIVSVNQQDRLVVLAAQEGFAKEYDARYYVENAPGALKLPGQWYLDRASHRVSYIPLPGQDMTHAIAIAPLLQQLIVLKGSPENGEFIRDIIFRGLSFEHTDWMIGATGMYDGQGAPAAVAAVSAVGGVGIHIEHCLFAHLGGYGLELGRGSKHNYIVASEFFDLGAGGIRVGETTIRTDDAQQNYETLISDNVIHHIGRVYTAGMGILLRQTARNRVLHNNIHDTFQTAISVGWTWGYGASLAGQNLIAYNDIYDIGQNMSSDMGGIYTLGVQPGTVLENNRIHDITSFTYGAWGLYLDEGSSHILAQNNIVYHCKSAAVHEHYGSDNLLRNNIFALNTEHELARTTYEPGHISFGLQSNIIYFDQGTVLGGAWAQGNFVLVDNLYYNPKTPDIRFLNQSFAQWQASGHDAGSRIADPRLVDPQAFDFTLKPDSPALKMGFKPIDMTTVGPRIPAGVGSR